MEKIQMRRTFFMLFIGLCALNGEVKETKNGGLIENRVLEMGLGKGLLGERDSSIKNVTALNVAPPLLQILLTDRLSYDPKTDTRTQTSLVFDFKKKQYVASNEFTNKYDYVKYLVKGSVPLDKHVSMPILSNWSKETKASFRETLGKGLLSEVEFEEADSRPYLLEIKGRKIYLLRMKRFEGPKPYWQYYYIQFLAVTAKGKEVSVVKPIAPKNQYHFFPIRIGNFPIVNKDSDFIQVDVDGDGIDDLIGVSGGVPHDEGWMTYNIFTLGKFVEYLEKN